MMNLLSKLKQLQTETTFTVEEHHPRGIITLEIDADSKLVKVKSDKKSYLLGKFGRREM